MQDLNLASVSGKMGDEIDGDGLGNERGRPPTRMKAARRIEGSWDEGEVSERSHSIARLTTSPRGATDALRGIIMSSR